MRNFLIGLFVFAFNIHQINAQIIVPAKWNYSVSKTEVSVGDKVDLIFTATIDKDWYLYSSDFDPECGPIVTTFVFTKDTSYELVGGIKAINPKKKYDDIFECDYTYFVRKGVFKQTIKVLQNDLKISGEYGYQVCTDVDGRCIPFEDEFAFENIKVTAITPSIEPAKKTKLIDKVANEKSKNNSSEVLKTTPQEKEESILPIEDTNTSTKKEYIKTKISGPILDESLMLEEEKDSSLIGFMIIAFLGGLTALFTPCVFPMIPMTVSFFTNKGGAFKALIYGASIIGIYTLIGAALAPIMGPDTANHIATEWLPNLIFFAVFVVFALSFFGLFEITLPSSFVNSMDAKADKGGLIGVFFMALTLVVVSFSCTGPIVGSLLVSSAGGEVLKPIAGMFAFSSAFAIPFTLFAIFPSWLNKLPKSGGWLNSVKVILGFIELAFAFKFLSIADQAFHWGILDREVNIAIWIILFTLMGFYLLGKIKLPHDSDLPFVSVPRLVLSIITFSFVLYLIPGMWGAPLKALAGYLPPMHTHDFDLIAMNRKAAAVDLCDEPKYGEFLHLPHGMQGYFDYNQALECARVQNKPVFIDFTGHGCTNCREMEAVVWSDPQVQQRLNERFVVLALYVDDKTELPEEAWYTSTYDNKLKKTIGRQNADLQINYLNNNAQPYYVLLGLDEHVLVKPYAYDKSVDSFIRFLDKGLEKFEELD